MEKTTQLIGDVTFRTPVLEDGASIYNLIKYAPPLDLNSSYLYFLQASHFADSCLVAEHEGKIIAFISGYFRPDKAHSFFIWQVAVAEHARGLGLASNLLDQLIKKQSKVIIKEICCTISPSNKASQKLFKHFADQHRFQLEVTPFLTEKHFANSGHEVEDLYSITTAYNENMLNTLLTKH